MRKILQFFILSVFAGFLTTNANAQIPLLPKLPKVLVFGNGTYANPLNADFKNLSNNGIGFEVGAGIGMGKTIFRASVGQMSYNIPARTGYTADHLKVTPLKFGVRKYLIAGLFLNANVGLAIQQSDNNSAATGSSFLYEGGAGFKFGFFEIGAAYTSYNMALIKGQASSITASSLLMKAGIAIKI